MDFSLTCPFSPDMYIYRTSQNKEPTLLPFMFVLYVRLVSQEITGTRVGSLTRFRVPLARATVQYFVCLSLSL